jgi:hypothetical protein
MYFFLRLTGPFFIPICYGLKVDPLSSIKDQFISSFELPL